ncbi:MAG: hypothetical protein L0Y71_00510 [Gemmataceae bacterium]|nr:hypothetical protein [Gemmataceae bacterium]
MKRVNLDRAAPAIKQFLRSLPLTKNGVELELGGKVIAHLIPTSALDEAGKAAVIARGRELVKRARDRNKGVPGRMVEREVRQAIDRVRARQRS